MSLHNTLNEALEATDTKLVDIFPLGATLKYNQTIQLVSNGVFISVYRNENGLYENAITYESRCDNFVSFINNDFS